MKHVLNNYMTGRSNIVFTYFLTKQTMSVHLSQRPFSGVNATSTPVVIPDVFWGIFTKHCRYLLNPFEYDGSGSEKTSDEVVIQRNTSDWSITLVSLVFSGSSRILSDPPMLFPDFGTSFPCGAPFVLSFILPKSGSGVWSRAHSSMNCEAENLDEQVRILRVFNWTPQDIILVFLTHSGSAHSSMNSEAGNLDEQLLVLRVINWSPQDIVLFLLTLTGIGAFILFVTSSIPEQLHSTISTATALVVGLEILPDVSESFLCVETSFNVDKLSTTMFNGVGAIMLLLLHALCLVMMVD